jgi:hypothetical protein
MQWSHITARSLHFVRFSCHSNRIKNSWAHCASGSFEPRIAAWRLRDGRTGKVHFDRPWANARIRAGYSRIGEERCQRCRWVFAGDKRNGAHDRTPAPMPIEAARAYAVIAV